MEADYFWTGSRKSGCDSRIFRVVEEQVHPTSNKCGMQNGSSVGISTDCIHVLFHVLASMCMLPLNKLTMEYPTNNAVLMNFLPCRNFAVVVGWGIQKKGQHSQAEREREREKEKQTDRGLNQTELGNLSFPVIRGEKK